MPWFSLAWSGVMTEDDEPFRDLAALAVPQDGRMVATGDRYEPYRLVDADGVVAGTNKASPPGARRTAKNGTGRPGRRHISQTSSPRTRITGQNRRRLPGTLNTYRA
jgi:hypothetical protein